MRPVIDGDRRPLSPCSEYYLNTKLIKQRSEKNTFVQIFYLFDANLFHASLFRIVVVKVFFSDLCFINSVFQ